MELTRSRITAAIAATALAVAVVTPSLAQTDAATATTAEDVGGMDALVAAAQAEGTLNVIALAPDWANYGQMIEDFSTKYGIEIESDQPDVASQVEIDDAQEPRGHRRAP